MFENIGNASFIEKDPCLGCTLPICDDRNKACAFYQITRLPRSSESDARRIRRFRKSLRRNQKDEHDYAFEVIENALDELVDAKRDGKLIIDEDQAIHIALNGEEPKYQPPETSIAEDIAEILKTLVMERRAQLQ